MSFRAFTIAGKDVPKGTGFGANLVKMRNGHARLNLFLRMAVAADLGWADQDRLELELGEDEHHGILRLRKAAGGSAVVIERATRLARESYIRIDLGHIDLFVDRSEPKKWCQFEAADDGWVEVVLPSWADDTGPRKRERMAALPGPRTLAIAPPQRHLVSAIAGDPPPGRSALDQRKPVTRGQARREAETREAPGMVAAEAEDWNRKAERDNKLANVTTAFGLTKTEGRYLVELLDGRLKTKEVLLEVGHDESEHVEIKLVDVFVCKLRKKLTTRLVEIETVRGQGYRMAPDMIARVMVLVDAGTGPGRDDDEAELASMPDADDESDAA